MKREFWRGKRVFLTGHTGFKGSWLSLWLQRLGAELTGYALDPPTAPSLFQIANVSAGMHSIIGDIRDYDALYGAIQATKPEIVIHMAAQPLVRHSYLHPVETYEVNVMGTINFLEALRHTSGISSGLIVTSDKCYQSHGTEKQYREDDMLGGADPYSNSKGCAELITSAYRASFFCRDVGDKNIAIASARAGNVIGGGDWAQDRLVPDTVTAFKNNKSVLIRNPHAVRPWQHVLEPLGGYLSLAENLFEKGAEFSQAWNFGPNEEDIVSVRFIMDQITILWGGEVAWEIESDDTYTEADFLSLSSQKARTHLNWSPRWGLQKALVSTINMYKAYFEGEDMYAKVMEQIEDFESSFQ
ncbi:CDP-glucose 4,6-dehydratase [Porticoccaceae bacterium]|nr:CDP-glucose 4,6-dehydratase [Porticoccaceae bacterium]